MAPNNIYDNLFEDASFSSLDLMEELPPEPIPSSSSVTREGQNWSNDGFPKDLPEMVVSTDCLQSEDYGRNVPVVSPNIFDEETVVVTSLYKSNNSTDGGADDMFFPSLFELPKHDQDVAPILKSSTRVSSGSHSTISAFVRPSEEDVINENEDHNDSSVDSLTRHRDGKVILSVLGGNDSPIQSRLFPEQNEDVKPIRFPEEVSVFNKGVKRKKRKKPSAEKCTCKNTRCLKKYCMCFAGAFFCNSRCSCINCENFAENVNSEKFCSANKGNKIFSRRDSDSNGEPNKEKDLMSAKQNTKVQNTGTPAAPFNPPHSSSFPVAKKRKVCAISKKVTSEKEKKKDAVVRKEMLTLKGRFTLPPRNLIPSTVIFSEPACSDQLNDSLKDPIIPRSESESLIPLKVNISTASAELKTKRGCSSLVYKF